MPTPEEAKKLREERKKINPLMLKKFCQRRVNGIKCTKEVKNGFCEEHSSTMCSVCDARIASYECVKCKMPLCTMCMCHDSFGQ